MNKLSKEKRNQLVLAAVGILAVLAGLYFTLIRFQQSALAYVENQKSTATAKLAEIRDSVKNSAAIEAELLVVSNKLEIQERDMPSGDLYASMVNTLRTFKLGRSVDIPQFSSPGTAGEMTMLPRFPYKQVVMSIVGTAYYHDLGRFVADFENQFPASRIVNIDLAPASSASPEDKEKLSFKMDIISLVKGQPATTTTTAKL